MVKRVDKAVAARRVETQARPDKQNKKSTGKSSRQSPKSAQSRRSINLPILSGAPDAAKPQHKNDARPAKNAKAAQVPALLSDGTKEAELHAPRQLIKSSTLVHNLNQKLNEIKDSLDEFKHATADKLSTVAASLPKQPTAARSISLSASSMDALRQIIAGEVSRVISAQFDDMNKFMNDAVGRRIAKTKQYSKSLRIFRPTSSRHSIASRVSPLQHTPIRENKAEHYERTKHDSMMTEEAPEPQVEQAVPTVSVVECTEAPEALPQAVEPVVDKIEEQTVQVPQVAPPVEKPARSKAKESRAGVNNSVSTPAKAGKLVKQKFDEQASKTSETKVSTVSDNVLMRDSSAYYAPVNCGRNARLGGSGAGVGQVEDFDIDIFASAFSLNN